MLFRMRDAEGCEPVGNLLWDTRWLNSVNGYGGYGDWIMADADDPAEQRGGMRARMQLHTAMLICLFTDKRLPDYMTPPGNDTDRRGWWGNSIRLEGEPEAELGSLLWTLERGTVAGNGDTAGKAVDYATEALQVLIDQGAVARFEITATSDAVRGRLELNVAAFDRAGNVLARPVFDIVWQQTRSPAPMNYQTR
jgi:phage gp46-like protein